MQVTIKQIKIGDRKRSLKTESVNQLAESIKEIGLLNPITITQDKRLISGMHRLEAVKLLGWTTIDCNVLHYNDALHEELIEIDENLIPLPCQKLHDFPRNPTFSSREIAVFARIMA